MHNKNLSKSFIEDVTYLGFSQKACASSINNTFLVIVFETLKTNNKHDRPIINESQYLLGIVSLFYIEVGEPYTDMIVNLKNQQHLWYSLLSSAWNSSYVPNKYYNM